MFEKGLPTVMKSNPKSLNNVRDIYTILKSQSHEIIFKC